MDSERDNLRSALNWTLQRDVSRAARLSAALWPYWHEFSVLHEGRQWMGMAIGRAGSDLPAPTRAQLLTGASVLAVSQGDYRAAPSLIDAALAIWRELDDHHGQAIVLRQRAWIAWPQGDVASALADFTEAVRHWRALAEPRGIAYGLNDLALLLILTGQFEEAQPLLSDARAICEQQDDRLGLARAIGEQGLSAMLQGDLRTAIPLLEQSVALCRPLGTTFVLPGLQFYLGTALCLAEQPAAALTELSSAIRLQAEMGDKLGTSLTLLAFAAAAHRLGQPDRAARLCGAVINLHEQFGMAMVPTTRLIYDREVAVVRAQLGDILFETEFNRSRELTLDEAVTYALTIG
ncbi:MAG: tetratricopeptide repeat protein, partial [Vicinamibacterales bacterium]